MIKRLQTPEEVSILFPKLPSSWVQWVTENCTNPKFYIMAEIKDELIGYIIVLNGVQKPISNFFVILSLWGNVKKLMNDIKKNSKKEGAEQIMMTAKVLTSELKELGFIQISLNIGMKI